jgi:hypothetical protein
MGSAEALVSPPGRKASLRSAKRGYESIVEMPVLAAMKLSSAATRLSMNCSRSSSSIAL